MKRIMFYLFAFVFTFGGMQLLAQEATNKQVPLPKDPNFKPETIKSPYVEGNIKWEETFDTTIQPSDWLVIDNDGSGSAYTFEQQINFTGGTVLPQAGQSFWFSNYTNANASGLIDEWLISPQIPTIEAGDSLIFYAGAIGGLYPDSLKVLISTTDQTPSSFTEIAYFLVDGPIGAWNRYAFDLSAFAGSQIYVAVNYYIVDGGPTGNNSDNVWVDHFIVTSAPSNTARVQVIHNSADVLAGSVDVYVNDALAIPDFGFREATPFIDLPAGVTLNIGIAPGNSGSVSDTLVNFPVVLDAGEKYVVFANGVLTSGYATNPDGRNTDFTLFVKTMARETGTGTGVDLFVLHGSTDAPTVDVKVRELSSATIVDDAAYGDITPYLTAPAQDITLDLYLGNGVNYVASFTAPLSGLGGGSAAVFASGFLDPTSNQNGEAFGLFAALANGTVVELPATSGPNARVQVIHNSADVLAGSVDVYVNDALAIPDFAFRAATPFIDLPAGVTLNIGVAPGNSGSVSDTLVNFPVILDAGETYVVFANGVLTSGYAPNPDGRNTDFTLFVKTMARESGTSSDVDFFVLHGSTDAPAVDVKVRELGSATIVDDAAYGDITGYLSAPPADYTLELYLADGTTFIESFIAPLNGLGGGSAAVFASGFLDPSSNQNGAPFGLFAALANGTVVELIPGVVPVELSSFAASVNGNNVTLNWSTVTETNNQGFEVQRKNGDEFRTIGFVEGKGTTTNLQNYSYSDSKLESGSYTYRLKQVDFDGSFEYSSEVNVDITVPAEFSLEQNYPNPFNPSTKINFNLAVDSDVTLKVFNILGQEVATLLNGKLSAGIQELNFDARNLNSGVYFYRIDANGVDGQKFSAVKKMILTK